MNNDLIVFALVVGMAVLVAVMFAAAVIIVGDDVAREGQDQRRIIAMQWVESHGLADDEGC
jgi:hypothetical protein